MKRFQQIWGAATGFLGQTRRMWFVDFILLGGIAGVVFGLFGVAHEWTMPNIPNEHPDLSISALPYYTMLTLTRGLIGYLMSIIFTLVYGYWAAKDEVAGRVLVPMLDILQSIPILGFMPGLVMAMVALFPSTRVGLELAAIITIFTGQAWNMTFSYYHSLRSVPENLREASTLYNFTWWERLKWLELPISTIGLVWNSMMSMAGGWFFIMISEQFKEARLPGLGSYMAEAVEKGDRLAQVYAIIAMMLMIIALDQFLWRPLVVWSQKFRLDDAGHGEQMESWFLDFLRRSKIVSFFEKHLLKPKPNAKPRPRIVKPDVPLKPNAGGRILSMLTFVTLLCVLGWGGFSLFQLLRENNLETWIKLVGLAFITLGRVLLSTTVATLIALPIGLNIGLSPKLSRHLQPVVQIVASFPAPMLFPMVLALMAKVGISIEWGSIVLMLLGTMWYIVFNVVAGAMAIPADIREAAESYNITGWQRFVKIYFPGVFPYLVTGWVTAAGGAWNTSIVAEYIDKDHKAASGLGSAISQAFTANNLALLAAAVVVMSLVVVTFNRLVWKRLYDLAETRYSLSR
jgi:NitT/TauT family transport system permease protein